ncbi:hypothetical protein [Aggregatibacter kilianii]|uniref:hypothetical protein n=1 Tax=Aggregatibacter kilianii TaxID=2025884 RepID=UPI000D646A22|nr:hypothetical protein [Aggregatibacter kilianii]
MKKFSLSILAVVTAFSLSACSSNGSDSNNNAITQPNPPAQTGNQVTQPTTPNQTNNQVAQPTAPNQTNNQVTPTPTNQVNNQIVQPQPPAQPSDPSAKVEIVTITNTGKYNGVAYEFDILPALKDGDSY